MPAVGIGGAQGGGLGSGREWTHCETPRARGSRDRPAEPRYPGGTCYPGTAHCFFAQEPVEAGGNVSGTMQGCPQSCWGPPFSDPTGGHPYVPPSKPLLPWHSPLGFPWLSLLTPPRLEHFNKTTLITWWGAVCAGSGASGGAWGALGAGDVLPYTPCPTGGPGPAAGVTLT